MEDRKLEAAESLALIGRMIENTRSRMVRNSGRPLLAWGYATVLTTLAVWGAVLYFQNPRWNYLWLMLPLLGWLLMWVSREKKPEGEVRTFVDRVIGNVWTVMGLSAWFVSMLALFTPMRLPILFIILLIMGMGTTVTGLIIRFTPTAVGVQPPSRLAAPSTAADAPVHLRKLRREMTVDIRYILLEGSVSFSSFSGYTVSGAQMQESGPILYNNFTSRSLLRRKPLDMGLTGLDQI